ncbi:MAG: hypothetical protein U0840_14510 [Gemmataceae bacterium]
MTEEQWLSSNDMPAMLDFLLRSRRSWRTRWLGWITTPRFSMSDRRLAWIDYAIYQSAVGIMRGLPLIAWQPLAHRHARSPLSGHELTRAQERLYPWLIQVQTEPIDNQWMAPILMDAAAALARLLGRTDGNVALLELSDALASQANLATELLATYTVAKNRWPMVKANALREIVGNPIRPTQLDPNWLLHNGGAVQHLAREIEARDDFDSMPILRDALLDAGCTDDTILEHCRSPRYHYPGCWVLDLLLGR